MYHSFFGLTTHPFRNTADPRFFFKTAAHEEALAAMLYGVTQRQGMTLVTGKSGTGKTLLAHLLVQALGSQADAVILPHLPDTGHELLTTLCRSFGIRYRQSHSASELIDRLKAHLLTRHHEGLYALVIMDEAEHMTPEVMEHVRLLSDLEYDSIKVPQLVLLARLELCEQLMQPAHEQFRQRIACARELEFLERDQTHGYVRYRLRQAGCDREDLFTEDALDYIHEQSGGSPRLINQLSDAALLSAYSVSSHIIDRETVAESVRGLMAVNLAMAPNSTAGATSVPSGENADRHLAAASSVTESIHEATRRGTEVLGRLDEVAKHALERVDLLTQLLARSESQAQSVLHAEQTMAQTSHAADERVQELHHRVEEARSLIVGLKATRARIKRWQKHGIDQMRKQSKAQRAVRHELDRHMQSAQSASGELVDQVARANEAMNAIDARVEQGSQEVARCIERVNRLASDLEARQLGGEECDRQLRQLMEELTERATQLDELSARAAEQTDAMQELLSRSGQAGEALHAKAQQVDEQFQQTLDRRVAEGREHITDLMTRMDARGQQLLEVLDTSRTFLDRLGHQGDETETRAAHLRTLLDEACRQVQELQAAAAEAAVKKQELTGRASQLDELSASADEQTNALQELLSRSGQAGEALHAKAQQVDEQFQQTLDRRVAEGREHITDLMTRMDARGQQLLEVLDTSRTLLDRLGHQGDETETRAEHLRTLLDAACRQVQELQEAAAEAAVEKQELTGRASQLDELSASAAERTNALQELLNRSGQAGEALHAKAEQIDEQFQQTLDRRVAEGREHITDLMTRMDARGQQLLDVLDTSRTLLDRLGHQGDETETRAEQLRTLLDTACHQVRELQDATAGATVEKQELTGLLARSEESAETLEERARWVIQHVQDELTTVGNSVQNLLDDVGSQQQALAQTLGEIDTALAQWRKSEASRRQSREEIEAMLARLEEGQSCSQNLVDEMTAATASLKPLLEGAHATLDALRQQQDHWQEAHQAVEASCDTVKGLKTSADSLQGALASLCQDAQGARRELASRLEELALRRREHDALLDRQRELEGAVASQIKQCRRTSWEIESSVRDANVASGQVSTRAHELAGRMNRAEELIAALDARLLRAEKITQQFRQVHDELALESREATRATRQLRGERLRAEGVLNRLSRAPDTYAEDDSDEEAREVPALRLRLSGRFDRRHGDDTDDPSVETSTSEATFRGAAS